MAVTTPIPTAVTTAGSKPAEGAASLRKSRSGDAEGAELPDGGAGFSRLLQAAGLPVAVAQTVTEVAQAAKSVVTEVVPAPVEDAATQMLPWVGDMAWTAVHSLVGQTAQLDQSGDVSVRNGTHLQARLEAGDPLGLSHQSMLAHSAGATPVVAQGVATLAEAASQAAGQPLGQAMQAGMAASALTQAAGQALDDVAAAMQMDGDAMQRGERAGEGRVALDGQWVAVDRQAQPAEAMQRLMGQMSQFLAATGAPEAAGLRRAGSKSADDSGSAVTDAAAAQGHLAGGSGRLLDSAVAQAAASQQAQGDTQGAQAEPDMAFWMNARQQRAELVLERDGAPVRVQVALDGNTAHITFRSDAETTRSQLDASLSQLRDMLAAQGVELAGVQVQTQAGGGQAGSDRQQPGFMPDGAQRVRLRGVGLEGVEPQMVAASAARTAQGVDVFA
ncbi:flagellar hook-length control protein FliK [Comamonas sp. GB3 AK4-5]|uniref:flagellar hook-length control protein FliK n=1 Tax=Comamonas sp. GB3 AK4-5 TaxID=3231487 RepID=UPI00351E6FC4